MSRNSLGQLLKKLRLARGLSMRALAEKVSVSAPYITDIEKGNRQPSEPLLALIAGALETDLDNVLAQSKRPPVKQMKDLIALDPAYAPALRKFVEAVREYKISPAEINAVTAQLRARA
jgi:transcriptional regulator with XRE-family HTH domain